MKERQIVSHEFQMEVVGRCCAVQVLGAISAIVRNVLRK